MTATDEFGWLVDMINLLKIKENQIFLDKIWKKLIKTLPYLIKLWYNKKKGVERMSVENGMIQSAECFKCKEYGWYV